MHTFALKDADGNVTAQDTNPRRVLLAWRRVPEGTPFSFYIDDRLIFTITPDGADIEPDTKADLFKMLYALVWA